MPDTVQSALPPGQAWIRVSDAISIFPDTPIAVGCSGGPDSAALAVVARDVCQAQGRELTLLHVHHGLQADADAWSHSVQTLARRLDVPLTEQRVTVDLTLGHGVEGAARQARYAALNDMMRATGSGVLLLAHHRQDQAETVLFRLIRGAGVQGLQAMRAQSVREGIVILRPWLDLDRQDMLEIIGEFSQKHDWSPVSDPSNLDPSFARGVLRTKLIPEIAQHWPQWASNLARHARQASDMTELLSEWADQCLTELDLDSTEESFCLKKWRLLSPPKQGLVIRRWLEKKGCRMPSEARLLELMRQLQTVHAMGHDRALAWEHDGRVVRCQQGRVLCTKAEVYKR